MTSEIPADIQAKAEQVRDLMWLHSSPRFAAKAVAEALLEERQRCAKVAEDRSAHSLGKIVDGDGSYDYWQGAASSAEIIIAAIRQQATP